MMMLRPSMVTGLSLVAVLAGQTLMAGVLGAAADGNPEIGKKLFKESCQHCHGVKGDGQSEMAAYLTPPPANLLDKATQSKTDEQLRTIILEGKPGTAMTGFEGAFKDAQVADLIAYVRSLQP